MRKSRSLIAVMGIGLIASACAGVPLHVNNPVMPGETVVREVEASATGIMLFNFIPIGQNPRFVTARDRALAQAPGATRLADMTISENWFWAWVLNGYKTTVHGTAVK